MWLIKLWLRWSIKRSAYQVLVGRNRDPAKPSSGRFTRGQVDDLLKSIWDHLDSLLPEANLGRYKTLGNRQNLYMAVATRAAYHSFVEAEISPRYATELISDVAWKVYVAWLPIPRFFARLASRDPQKQMNFILRAFLRYPFSEPGYQRKVWEEPDGLCTNWYLCLPQAYFKEHGTPEEMLFFNRTWCTFDWAIAEEMVAGGWYERPHTLSAGDDICDMTWHGRPQKSSIPS
jgi:hypothetical protein